MERLLSFLNMRSEIYYKLYFLIGDKKKKNEKKGVKVLNERIIAHANLVHDNDGKDGIPLKDIVKAWELSSEKGVRSYVKKGGMQHFYIKDGLLYAKESTQ